MIAIIVTVILTGGGGTSPISDNPGETAESTPDVTVKLPPNTPTNPPDTEDDSTEESGLIIEVGGNPSPTATPENGGNDKPKEPIAQPVEPQKPQTPPANTDNPGGGIVIGNGEAYDTPYSCGSANHKCESSEVHAFIANLETTGCPTCGSKSCVSFYALDQWGKTHYTPSKCPKYDVKNDPVHYCQDCDKKTGDGSKNTCVQFVNAANCPNCGKQVGARVCHSCD